MYLYNLSLQQSTAITQAIYGNFTAPKAQEIVVSKGTILELFQIDEKAKLQTIITKEVFGQIRKIMPFRLIGNNKDYIIVGSDSGRIVILEADFEKREFIKIHQETFGKTGCRRIVPGDYLASDPKGRAVMISATEKQKFVYILNRDNSNKMTISSPLEAHKSHTICFDICGLDVGYENPLFVAIEVDYGDSDNENSSVCTGDYVKMLTYYEMDMGLNHVVRKNFEVLPQSAHMLISVPGNPDGPGGVIICCENKILYRNINHEELSALLPRRNELLVERGVMIVSSVTHKQKDLLFFLVQSEYGDIYKINLQATSDMVHGIHIQYFDTTPTAVSLCVLKNGFLFTASEFGNHGIYQFQSIGDDDDSVSTYSNMPEDSVITFNPRNNKNISLVEEVPSLSCITDIHVEDLIDEKTPQIYTLCGKGPKSSLRVLKHGLQVNEMASSPLPGKPAALWTIKGSIGDQHDKYIVVSLLNATLVLSIGERVQEVQNSGFDSKKPTIHAAILEDNSFIQVFPLGIIHIKSDKRKALYQINSKIICASSNQKQIVLALQEKELIYFELNNSGNLDQIEKKVLDSKITAIDIGAIPEGRQRCKFLAVACSDLTVKLLSLEHETCLARISTQALPSMPESVALIEMKSTNFMNSGIDSNELFLHIGLNNGVLLRTAVDSLTGNLSDTRNKYLGSKAVSLFKISVQGSPALLAVSSKSWLCYNFMSKYFVTSLSYDPLDYVSCFSSDQCGEGSVAISDTNLKIFSFERLGEIFNQTVVPLRYTPRKMVVNPETKNIVIIESDHNCYSKREKDLIKQEISTNSKDPEYLKLKEEQIGVPFAGEGRWGSCIRMIEPNEYKLLDLIEFEENEAAFSACIMGFNNFPNELFLIVGTSKDMKLNPRSSSSNSIIVFVFKDGGKKIEFLHRTPCEELPMAFCEFQGRLLCGVGNLVRIYELGKKKLLKKCETKKLSSLVNGISISGQRIFVNTISESFNVLRYKANENQLYLFADDIIPRWLTSSVVLDYDTIAGADKFENFFILRLPNGCDEESEEDPMGTRYKWEIGYLNGAAFKMEQIAQFHRGELITSMRKCSLANGSTNLVVYGTTMGSVGVFMPFESREDVDFFTHLEMYLRLEKPPICGRDHQMYRSAYLPVKCVIDGDLCEEFGSLEFNKQKILGFELDKSPNEILKKLEEIRNKIL